ncbi:LOW QUALITY PROTEIN: hypothetical protein PanWU01x14_150640 [Parasponia andersonii]|uniref:Transmembrane protein n=1 Tax=Parasponia andersonii TaxID=3476 RepID=A0A2P5CI92_PARAD|nr:LOW QUALITY PROTEIN: hypothetical protein PanWU01x14_150640 [Parasponia andersonii]
MEMKEDIVIRFPVGRLSSDRRLSNKRRMNNDLLIGRYNDYSRHLLLIAYNFFLTLIIIG